MSHYVSMFSQTSMSFWSGNFFRGETALELPGPGCEPLTHDFGYEFLGTAHVTLTWKARAVLSP